MEIKCKRSGLLFEASSARQKQHPQISAWLQQANKEGWYAACVEAIEEGRKLELENIPDFLPLIESGKQIALDQAADREAIWKQKLKEIVAAKNARKELNEKLRQYGYRWQKCELLDETQGETGEYYWSLFQGDRWVGDGDRGVAMAIAEIEAKN